MHNIKVHFDLITQAWDIICFNSVPSTSPFPTLLSHPSLSSPLLIFLRLFVALFFFKLVPCGFNSESHCGVFSYTGVRADSLAVLAFPSLLPLPPSASSIPLSLFCFHGIHPLFFPPFWSSFFISEKTFDFWLSRSGPFHLAWIICIF